MSRKERRVSAKRAQERADRLAKAMPPPPQAAQVDPLTGKPLFVPSVGVDQLKPVVPSTRPVIPPPGSARSGATHTPGGAPARTPEPQAQPTPTPTPKPKRQRRAAGAPTRPPSPPAAAVATRAAHAGGAQPLRRTLAEPIGAPKAARFLTGGAAGAVVGLVTAVSFALPVEPAYRDAPIAAAGVLVLGLGAYLAFIGWAHSGVKTRAAAATVATLAGLSFLVGATADPIVLDGKVLVETSSKAQSVRLADSVYDDLTLVAGHDDLLVASMADARANVSDYAPAVKDLYEMSAEYSRINVGDLPNPAFAAVVESMKTTTYWAAKAMETKTGLIEQEDARAEADLETQRASFADNWVATATELKNVAAALDIPYTTDLEGPHE